MVLGDQHLRKEAAPSGSSPALGSVMKSKRSCAGSDCYSTGRKLSGRWNQSNRQLKPRAPPAAAPPPGSGPHRLGCPILSLAPSPSVSRPRKPVSDATARIEPAGATVAQHGTYLVHLLVRLGWL
ncbi:Hypothetical predicted protein [Marmota monax]|uniref:Uncharacterized protein n=1 Tax=Marmota monax TaxID=9995 RepID=A0A5E4A7F6_MARMO|nr:hypothetical protein GHT09_003497 [Marmota monax]VTJ53197.1 Hypothetical predicted protein [Marmota monax]